MQRRNFIQLAAGASFGAGISSLIAATGNSVISSSHAFSNGRVERFGDGRDWFFKKRFGMFIHWGLTAFQRPTEACQSVGIESWGYREDEDFYTDRHLMRSIDRYLVRDANYLLNLGPKSDGTLPDESVAIFNRIGKWYAAVKESFEDVQPASTLLSNRNVMLTSRNNILYVHLNSELPGNVVKLRPFNVAPVKATLLNDGRKVDFVVRFNPSDHREQKAYLSLINLPVNELSNTVSVIKLEFDRPLNDLIQSDSPMDGESGWGLYL